MTENEVKQYDDTMASVDGVLTRETETYQIFKLPNGEFDKRMKYKKFWTKIPVTKKDTLHLFKVMNDQDNSIVTPMKETVGMEIEVANLYFNPYESFDEKTGGTSNGVTTIIEDTKGAYYGTSSKAVYYSLHNIMDVFGIPNTENYEPFKILVTSKKLENGNQINAMLLDVSDDEPKKAEKK